MTFVLASVTYWRADVFLHARHVSKYATVVTALFDKWALLRVMWFCTFVTRLGLSSVSTLGTLSLLWWHEWSSILPNLNRVKFICWFAWPLFSLKHLSIFTNGLIRVDVQHFVRHFLLSLSQLQTWFVFTACAWQKKILASSIVVYWPNVQKTRQRSRWGFLICQQNLNLMYKLCGIGY